MKLLYFAWIRERTGRAEEDVELPADVTTLGDLVAWLRQRGEEFEHAFADPAVVRAAIDRTHAPLTAPIAGAREIAFFPPMTGG
ncbi:molybdopterin converting factor subunit 1 [Tepidamorphus gemmatus]|uniref:molybdopterin converting factor subunit 1 n=1 Tax=Tepidamorphus gemmatus TaxID=747076 RepID=UPI000AF5CAF1|nr:molybdopterin converting factor subunit 1 [Tepidamorphus gemmatus]